jgi:hypothetical protein
LFDWAYAKAKSPEQLHEQALAWWMGIDPEQAHREKPQQWSNILQLTQHWKWPAIQAKIREKIERIFLPSEYRKQAERVTADRQLGVFTNPDGEQFWYYYTVELLPKRSDKWVSAAIDRVLLDLQDLSVKVVHRCEQCGRLFVRLRPTRSRYCSGSCRGLAYLETHGFKPARERSGKDSYAKGKRLCGARQMVVR